jgi:hypothetical protein
VAGGHRHDTVIDRFEGERVQIDKVTGYVECRDLSASVFGVFVARSETIDDQGAIVRARTLGYEVLPDAEPLSRKIMLRRTRSSSTETSRRSQKISKAAT